jgi:hypothetical protein
MARARVRLFALIGGCACSALSACMTDHAALEKRPSAAGGAAGSGGVLGTAGHAPTSGTGGVGGTGGHPDDEAPGTSVLTIVHGVVDAPSVLVCWAKVADDGTVTPFGKPVSRTPLEYGQSIVLSAITGADPASDVLEPFLLAGELDLVSGLDCAAAIERAQNEEAPSMPSSGAAGSGDSGAGGSAAEGGAGAGEGGAAGAMNEPQPRLRARGLPAIPANTLNGGRSYLLVASGCLGGAGFSAANAEAFCGAGYSEREPTVTALFVALSRVTSAADVGLQVMHASLATGPISVSSRPTPPSSESPISIVRSDVPGGLLPRPAYIGHTAFDYGSARGYRLEVAQQSATLLTETWADVLAQGGISALEDGSNYALVLIGPRADLTAGPAFWNLPAVTVVAADPE